MQAPRALATGWLGLAGIVAVAAALPLQGQITAADDAYTTDLALALTVPSAEGVLANDAGGNESGYSAVLATPPSNGALILGGDGGFFYLPNILFSGNDTFTYQVNDGTSASNVATVTITVAPPGGNLPPVGLADSYPGTEDSPLDVTAAGGVLANDSDPEAGPLTAVLFSSTSNGTLTFSADGSFRYVPDAGFNGADGFQYRARDGGGAMSAPIAVSITVSAMNDAPVAAADSYSTAEDSALSVGAGPGVLDNDTDPDGNPLTAVLVSSPSSGTLTLQPNGAFDFAPAAGFNGAVTFTYQADDGTLRSNTATVTITVSAVNDLPTTTADSYATDEDTPLSVAAPAGVLANDTDPDGTPLTAVLVAAPSSGTLALQPNGAFDYSPAAGFNGTVTFTYQADDGAARSTTATVTITISAVNDSPTALADSYSTAEDTPLNVAAAGGVLANDTDPDGGALTAVLVSAASSGTLTLQPNGALAFTPVAGFSGTVTFTYHATDGTVTSNTATATITVNAVNDPPTASADSYTTAEDTELVVPAAAGVLANDTDADTGTTLTAALIGSVANGTLNLREDGSFTFAPGSNFSGTTTFAYQARDGSASSATMTVTINVTAANDAPLISNAPPTTATEDVTYGYTLTATDADGNPLVITAPTLPGWLTFSAPATIAGTPTQSDAGVHDVTMQVSDGVAPAVSLSFQITVSTVDNAPAIATIPPQTATEGAPFDLDLATFVTDADTPAGGITYKATSGVPPGLTLTAAGRLSGTPPLGASVGAYTMHFTVADAKSVVPAQVAVTVIKAGRIDLAVTLSATPNPVTLDAPVTWTITIANGAATAGAPDVTLDALFSGDVPFRFDAPTTSGCTATPSGNQTALGCTLGPLAGGASTTITLTGSGSFAGDVFGHATVATTSAALDEVPGNDTATASLSIAQRVSSAPEQRIPNVAARAVAAADFNNDGFDDLAVATTSSQGLLLYANVVDPTNTARRGLSATPQSLGGEALGTDLAIVDLDRDGDLDIVLAAAAGAPDRAFLAGSGGSFSSVALGAAARDSRAVAVGDINGDAFVDLVLANPGGSSVLMNTGSGAVFANGPRIGTGDARDVLLVDLLGDGLPELVLANGNGDATVYANSGGVFTAAGTLATGPTSAVAAGDFNADGRADLVFGRETAKARATPATLVLLNGASGFFLSDELGAATTSSLLMKDFDLDSRNDVLALNTAGIRIFTNAGAANGTFVLHPQQLATPGARGVAAGKFSNDDRVDLAVVGDGIAVFINDGKGNFGSGDSTPPTLTLRGEPTINIVIDSPFTDPGVTATDAVDGDLTSRVVRSGAVNNALLGTYTITYTVTDLSGNAATPVTRTVNVQAQPAADEGGGGGAIGELLLALLLASWFARSRRPLTTR
jgi:VCBS repeat-containing protein